MAITASQVSVGTSATALFTGAGGKWGTVIVRNDGAADVFLGPSGVTTGNGFKLATGTVSPPIEVGPGDDLYGVVATGTNAVHVLRSKG